MVILSTNAGDRTIERQASSWALIKRGVPQGWNLGPTLLLLFTNNLPTSVNSANTCLLAYETILTLFGHCYELLEQKKI